MNEIILNMIDNFAIIQYNKRGSYLYMDRLEVAKLLSLRRDIDNRIDNEIESFLRGHGDKEKLLESLIYIIEHQDKSFYSN